jgi:2-iminobutanoate/2-iminopropanoate deaminase
MTIRYLTALCTLALVAAASFTVHAQVPRTFVDGRSGADGNVPPYSGAVLVGDMLYLAGALGTDEDLEVPDDPADEARNVMNAIKRNVEAAGMTMDDIVSIQVFCTDLDLYQTFNDVYRTFFTQEYPARAFIGVGTLLFDARFEVQGVAIRR